MNEEANPAPAAPERDCQECYYQDEITGSCTNDKKECVDGDQFARALGPEDMYKALYLLIFNMPFTIQKHVMDGTIPKQSFAGIPVEVFDNFDEEKMKILIEYDPEKKRYILETSIQPKANLILVPSKKKLRRRKLILPGRN